MIDTMGFGIREVMWKGQARRYFPLPDFDLSDPAHVVLRLQGRFIDENYSRALFIHADLPWPEVLALDAVQKGLPADEETVSALRHDGLIEGRRPNLHVAAEIAAMSGEQADYIKHRAFDDRYFCDLILAYLKTFSSGKRADFRRLLNNKISDLLDDRQRDQKVNNLLQRLRKEGKIVADGKTRAGVWKLRLP